MQHATETWNGTNWTEVNDLNTARESLAGNGTTLSFSCLVEQGLVIQLVQKLEWN
jgi:hypothetical protein